LWWIGRFPQWRIWAEPEPVLEPELKLKLEPEPVLERELELELKRIGLSLLDREVVFHRECP